MKAGDFYNLEEFLQENNSEITDHEKSLVRSISDEYGFEFIQVTSNGEIAVYTTKESPSVNKYSLPGVRGEKFRGLIIR